jgi:hypothetical protein
MITDTDNNRVLIWNTIPSTNYAAADIVMGQTDCSSRGYSPVSQSTMRKPYDLLIFPGSPDKLLVTDFDDIVIRLKSLKTEEELHQIIEEINEFLNI